MTYESLEEVRSRIDEIDNAIIALIGERTECVRWAGTFKKDEQGVKDPSRVEKVIARVRAQAVEHGADPDMVEALYREMIGRFIGMEMKQLNGLQ